MKKNTSIFVIAILAIFANLGLADTYSYEIDEVESLQISAGVNFTVSCADKSSLEIVADTVEDFQMSLEDKTLTIKREKTKFWPFSLWSNKKVTADITLRHPPNVIDLTSGANGTMKNCFNGKEDLTLSASSGSSLDVYKGTGSIDQLEVDISSGANIEIDEKIHINHLLIDASSGSNFDTDNDVIIETAKVSISSGASVDIRGVRQISGKVSSGGNLKVSDSTKRTDLVTSSGGGVNAYDD